MVQLKVLIFLLPLCYGAELNGGVQVLDEGAHISYTLWIGDLVDSGAVGSLRMHNMNLTVAAATTFYQVMKKAAEQNLHYVFKATGDEPMHYVTEIGGWHEIPALRYHWMIYKLPALPNPWQPPPDDLLTPVGVDGIQVQDGEHYLFWFHKLKKWEH